MSARKSNTGASSKSVLISPITAEHDCKVIKQNNLEDETPAVLRTKGLVYMKARVLCKRVLALLAGIDTA